MKFAKSQISSPIDLRSFLGEGTEIVGEVRFTEIMRLDALVTGQSTPTRNFAHHGSGPHQRRHRRGIGRGGGTVEGKITARTSVKILSTAEST